MTQKPTQTPVRWKPVSYEEISQQIKEQIVLAPKHEPIFIALGNQVYEIEPLGFAELMAEKPLVQKAFQAWGNIPVELMNKPDKADITADEVSRMANASIEMADIAMQLLEKLWGVARDAFTDATMEQLSAAYMKIFECITGKSGGAASFLSESSAEKEVTP